MTYAAKYEHAMHYFGLFVQAVLDADGDAMKEDVQLARPSIQAYHRQYLYWLEELRRDEVRSMEGVRSQMELVEAA